MKIGIDVMGGDYAPEEPIKGATLAQKEISDTDRIVLIGNKEVIISQLKLENADEKNFDIVHASEIIEMGEHPTKAIQQKPNSSIAIGFYLLKEKKIDAFISAGNTGAMLVGTMFSIKTIPGILRPTIGTIYPKDHGWGFLLDVGVNADCKPENLVQFGLLGSLYAKHILKIENPRVALVNLGEEEGKGNILSQAAYSLMKTNGKFNFVGNIEGRDLLEDKADVMVCDGFTGNVILKLTESFTDLIKRRKIQDHYFDRLDFEDYGGTPILGANAPVLIGHGISSNKAFKNMIFLAKNLVDAGLIEIFKSVFELADANSNPQ